MPDTVNVDTIRSGGRYHVLHLQCVSDATGESAVQKLDISAQLTSYGEVPTYFTVDFITYDIQGFTYVQLLWDHTTPDEIATMSGSGQIDWQQAGGKTDPKSAGGTGDLLLTSVGAAANATYDITIWLRLKA